MAKSSSPPASPTQNPDAGRRRHRIAEGIYKDAWGLAATVKVGRVQRERRFQSDTDIETIKSWRIQTRAQLDAARHIAKRETAGTLAEAAQTYLLRKKGQVAYKADRSHLRAWLPTFGPRQRSSLTRDDVQRQIETWKAANVAARTIRHRCRVLRDLYRTIDGQESSTPIDYLKLPTIPTPHPVAISAKTIRDVAKRLRSAGLMHEYARFVVRATTGQRPAQIMRATPADVDFKRRIWFVKPAKGGDPVPLPLNDEMVAAWKQFAAAKAWGAFDTTVAARVLREHGWPHDVRPYALRHTFAIDLLLSGADLGDVQGLLGHAQIQTTRTHYGPILVARLRKQTAKRKLRLG